MHSPLLLVTCVLVTQVSLKDKQPNTAGPKKYDRPKTSAGTSSCPPAPPAQPPGSEGAPCSVHTACTKGFICVLQKGAAQGSCDAVSCGENTECEGATALPSRCSAGKCTAKHCYENSECPEGYGCFDGLAGNQCKKVALSHGASQLENVSPGSGSL